MTIWFTSDIHFSHESLIRHCNRPWDNKEEMNAGIIANWNEIVQPNDQVYILGDVAMTTPRQATDLVSQLKGRKYLIAGNHDSTLRKKQYFRDQFEWVKDLHTVKVQDESAVRGVQRIELCHYPMEIWNMAHYGAWHLHGHSHGSMRPDYSIKRMDVGLDIRNYRPISYAQVKERFDKWFSNEWKPKDHHGTHKVKK